MKKGRGYYCYIILPKGSGKPTKKIISNSSTPVEVYNKYIYNMDVETGRLLSAGVKFTRFTEQIIKTLSPIQNKHILFLKIRYKYNYIFR